MTEKTEIRTAIVIGGNCKIEASVNDRGEYTIVVIRQDTGEIVKVIDGQEGNGQ